MSAKQIQIFIYVLATLSRPLAAEEVSATWYGESYRGSRTASGETFNPDDLTAAHPSLPFGTLVEVRGPDGRTVVVRINDRGPAPPYGIDLSRAAARAIGLNGAAVVEVERVGQVAWR